MKKLILLLIFPMLLVGCSATKSPNDVKVQELEQKIITLQSQQASTTNIISPATSTPITTIETITSKASENISKTASTPKPKDDTSETPAIKSNDQICQDNYGLNSGWNGTRGSNGGLNCDCKSGYAWNTQRTGCVNPSTTPAQQPIKTESPEIKIAKCEAEKTQLAQTYQRVEDAAKQMTYTNTLTELNTSDPCGKAFTPEAISICYNGHATLARSIAIQSYNEMHSKNLMTIQNSYIACLNR